MYNVELGRQTLARIEANPGVWCQGLWQRCFGGIAAEIANPGVQRIESTCVACPGNPHPQVTYELDGQPFSHEKAGQKALGLTWETARGLFNPSNTLDDIRAAMAKLEAETGALV